MLLWTKSGKGLWNYTWAWLELLLQNIQATKINWLDGHISCIYIKSTSRGGLAQRCSMQSMDMTQLYMYSIHLPECMYMYFPNQQLEVCKHVPCWWIWCRHCQVCTVAVQPGYSCWLLLRGEVLWHEQMTAGSWGQCCPPVNSASPQWTWVHWTSTWGWNFGRDWVGENGVVDGDAGEGRPLTNWRHAWHWCHDWLERK